MLYVTIALLSQLTYAVRTIALLSQLTYAVRTIALLPRRYRLNC